ncbi:DnaJ domain-containing protein [Xylaria sp. FL1777]|nr:DnaJ domain-containing protein [Xylaria sp. FL1777]
MSSVDFYKVLNVANDADVATIQKAFRGLSLKLHPDKANASTIPPSGVETEAEKKVREQHNHERFVEIVEARDTLIDPTKRRKYDQARRIKKNSINTTGKPSNPNQSSRPSEASNSEKKTPSQRTTPQETRSDPDHVSNATIRRLERLDSDLDRMLSTFRRLVPRSGPSSDIISLFSQVIAINMGIRNNVREARGRLRDQGSTARAAYESAIKSANSHILLTRELASKLDAVLVRREVDLPRGFLYSYVYATLVGFLDS